MPLTVGTAGHIDHGKTTLVEALTGKNTDRLPQEQERGISIDLGYAPLELPDGTQLSVVDVPGHERFVRTMVAGATGIDLFLLVIDANEGARPQTHEHLAILRLLGIERGVVALTKRDLVDDETLELARAEAEELVPGAPVVAVAAYPSSYRLDVELDELAEIPGRVQVHHGTASVLARVVRVGARFAQLRLAAPVVAARGDHVVLRAETTVGGGRVIDPAPPRHASAERMELVERGEIAATVHEPVRAESLRHLGELAGIEEADVGVFSRVSLHALREEREPRLAGADPRDPGIAPPADPCAGAPLPLRGRARRGA